MVPNLDIKKWKEITASIKQNYNDLTVVEQSAFDVLVDHHRYGSFGDSDIKDLISNIKKDLNKHAANRKLQDYLKNFAALCDKYYIGKEERFNEFKQAMKGPSSRPLNNNSTTSGAGTQRPNSQQTASQNQTHTQSPGQQTSSRPYTGQQTSSTNANPANDDGRNRIKFSDGSFYVGDIKDGMPNGEGTRYFSNGNRYTGSWVNGAQNGFGTMVLRNGIVYEGTFQNGFCAKHGAIKWSDGTRYEGSWNNSSGEMIGRGTFINTDGTREKRIWRNGYLVPYESAGEKIKNFLYEIGSWVWEHIIYVPFIPVVILVIIAIINGKWLDAVLTAILGSIVALIFSYLLSLVTGILEIIYYWFSDRSKAFKIILVSLIAIGIAWNNFGDKVIRLKEKVIPTAAVEQNLAGKWDGKLNGAAVVLDIQSVKDTVVEASMTFPSHGTESLKGIYHDPVLALSDVNKNGWYDGDYHCSVVNDSVITGNYSNSRNGIEYSFDFKKRKKYE